MMLKRDSLHLLFLFILTTTVLSAQDEALQLANEQLTALSQEKKYAPTDIAAPIVTDHYTSNGITHIYYQQTVDQIGIYGTSAAVHLKDGEVITSNIGFLKGLLKRDIKKQFQVQALEAVARIALDKNYPLSQTEIIILSANEEAPQKPTEIQANNISNRTIPLKLVFLENEEQDLQLAWSVFIDEKDSAEYKNFLVNATTGAIEAEINLTISCDFGHHHGPNCNHDQKQPHEVGIHERLKTVLDNYKENGQLRSTSEKVQMANSYNVFPIPIESPNHGNRSIVTAPWNDNPTASPNGWHQIGSTTYTTTRGNNVDAYIDDNNTNSPTNGDAARANGGANLEFNSPLDLSTTNPINNRDAALTNLFYWNNVIHDVWYNYGFDEASGNFQEENFGTQGNAGDYVYAEAQDGSGNCNANMSTPPDGGNPRMQMYNCLNSSNPSESPVRDGDFDNPVIVHEYGHGISIRLTGGPSTSACLGFSVQEQMGEGWSDFFGLIMTIQPGDVGTNSRPMGTWLFRQSASGRGIRAYPYNTDMSVNPMTYNTIKSSSTRAPHGVGSVWATMLWDLTWAMIDEYGWDPDLYNGTGGNNKTMALVIEGLKLQPCSPGFVDGRDAILAADQTLNGGANQCLIWEVFTRRGLGYSAVQGSSSSKTDNEESFDLPPSCTISMEKIADKKEASLGENITYTISATNLKNSTVSNLVLTDFLPNYLDFVSASDNGTASGQTVTWPAVNLAPNQSVQRTLVAQVKENLSASDTILTDDFESGMNNWTVVSNGNSSATWTPQNTRFASSSTAVFSPGVPSTSSTTLTIASARELTSESELIFNHFYEIERRWDGGIIEISTNNGVSWTDLGPNITQNGYTELVRNSFNAFSNSSGGWIETRIDLSAYAGENVLIRWNMIFDISVSWEGWYVDDIQLTNLNVNVLNRAQISNGDITSTVFVEEPTRINFAPVCEQNNNFGNGAITADNYRVDNNITSSGTVKTGTSVGFYAGSSITLRPGFHAESGSNFLARIEGCTPSSTNNAVPPIAQARLANFSPNQNQSLRIFPNPFRQQTAIEFEMAETGRLWIGLQDLTGRTIKVIRQATNHPMGSNQIILQNEGLKSGIYWLTMQTEQGITTKKLFLLE